MHVHAGDLEAVPGSESDDLRELPVPDSVLRVVAAGICLLAVAVTKSRVNAKGDVAAGRALTELVDHIRGADVHVDPLRDGRARASSSKMSAV